MDTTTGRSPSVVHTVPMVLQWLPLLPKPQRAAAAVDLRHCKLNPAHCDPEHTRSLQAVRVDRKVSHLVEFDELRLRGNDLRRHSLYV